MLIRSSLAIAAGVAMVLTLAVWGTASGSSPSATTAAAQPVKSIFFANPLPAYPDWATANKCFKSEASKLGVKAVTQGPTGLKINDQFVLDRISQAVAQKYDGLMAVPITPSAYEPLFKRAKKAGMRIGTLNTGNSTKTQDFTVGTDYSVQGKQVARNIAKRRGQQNVGIISNAPGGIGATIIAAFKKNLPANVKVVTIAYDKADPTTTADVVNQMLTAHPTINIVFSWEGTAVAGITTAIKEKKKVGKVFGVVNDLTPQVVDGIRKGTLYGTSQQHFCEMAKQSVDKLVALGKGQKVARATDTGTTFVTKQNLNKVLAQAKNQS